MVRESKLRNPVTYLLRRARARAKEKGLEFDLEPKDIAIPERCPVLGIPLKHAGWEQRDGSPSLDRIDNKKGYVKGNVVVVSFRANHIKTDATVDELVSTAAFYRTLQLKG